MILKFLKIYITALAIFFIVDFTWLGLIAKTFYKNQIGYLMAENVNWIAAITFYLIFIFGLCYFVLFPALVHQNFQKLIVSSLLFGFITYATYDLTNLAVTKDWPLLVTIVDMAWGAVLSCSVALGTYFISKTFSWL